MTTEQREKIADLKNRLKELQADEQKIMVELEKVKSEEKKVIDELSSYSSEKYEQDMLELVYQQRRRKN